jgi:4-amino-4-deoxy-L-arabinose transferase-like glycosyltransferase
MAERTPWFQVEERVSWLHRAVRPSTCWWIIGASVAAFAAVGLAAASLYPPAVAMADDDFTLAAILAVAGIVVFVSGNVRPFGRPAQLATFVALMTVGFGWYSARQWTHARQATFLVERQTQQIRLNAMQLSANLVNFLRDRRKEVPPPPAAATWDADERRIIRFEAETVRLYEAKFAREVRSSRDLLAIRGLRDRDLDTFYRRPANEFQIQTIAIKLSTLGRRLDH